jgi:hypothetical protein
VKPWWTFLEWKCVDFSGVRAVIDFSNLGNVFTILSAEMKSEKAMGGEGIMT